VAAAATCTGCAIGNQHAYHTITPQVQQPGAGWVAIAVDDRREAIVRGDKTPDFVGLSRGGYGNTFDVTTASEQALAVDFAETVARGLQQAGYRVSVVPSQRGQTPAKVMAQLARSGAGRFLLLRLNQWRSDTYQNTALDYDVVAMAFDGRGGVLAEKQLKGRDNLGGSFWNPPAHAKSAVPQAFQQKLEMLLNDPSITNALRVVPSGPATARVQLRRPTS
jgi:hypothetical protein